MGEPGTDNRAVGINGQMRHSMLVGNPGGPYRTIWIDDGDKKMADIKNEKPKMTSEEKDLHLESLRKNLKDIETQITELEDKKTKITALIQKLVQGE
jgi:hypothetical protein